MKVVTPYPILVNGRNVNKSKVFIYSNFDDNEFSYAGDDTPKGGVDPTDSSKPKSFYPTPTGESVNSKPLVGKKPIDAEKIAKYLALGMTAAEIVKAFKKDGKSAPSESEIKSVDDSRKKMSATTKAIIGVSIVALIVGVAIIVNKNK